MLNVSIELLHVKFNYMQLSLLNRAEVDFMLYCLLGADPQGAMGAIGTPSPEFSEPRP